MRKRISRHDDYESAAKVLAELQAVGTVADSASLSIRKLADSFVIVTKHIKEQGKILEKLKKGKTRDSRSKEQH